MSMRALLNRTARINAVFVIVVRYQMSPDTPNLRPTVYGADKSPVNRRGEVERGFSGTLERRTECDRATVKTSGVFWRCYPKHCDIELAPAEITVEQLQEIVVREGRRGNAKQNVAHPLDPPRHAGAFIEQ